MDRTSEQTENYPVREERLPMTGLYLFIKRLFYRICKWGGLFRLARRRTRGRLMMICYHGFSLVDESRFLPRTFIGPATFRRRMEFLAKKGFSVLGLEEALDLLDRGEMPTDSVVITIDDGFYSMYGVAWPILREFSYPATVYVTTYYAVKGNPVFGLVVDYMFWKSDRAAFDSGGLGLPFEGEIPIVNLHERSLLARDIIRFGETNCDEEERVRLSEMIGERLGVDFREITESRILSIMNTDEIGELSRAGVDIQLHTHRHDLGTEREVVVREITECRAVLEPVVGRKLVHFCYPGGRWYRKQWPWLEELGILSAATCDRGLNDSTTPKLGLKRFGDDAAMSQIEFEAELSGFAEILRSIQAGSRRGGRKNGKSCPV